MRFRPPAGTLLASLLWSLPGVILLPATAHAQAANQTALVTAVRGNVLTLAVGTNDGAKIGQTYRLSRGNVGAKVQITGVSAAESTAAILFADAGYIVTVGETARFLGEEPLAAPPAAAPGEPLPNLPPAPPQTATQTTEQTATYPTQALITSVMGNKATLSIGAADGAVSGAVYVLPLEGAVRARLQITTVRASDSVANLTILEEGFTPTVGEMTRFLGVETVLAPAPLLPPANPFAPPVNPVSPMTPVSPTISGNFSVEAAPVSALSGSTATVTAIDGQSVIISAGRAQGARPAQNVPLLRGGQVIGLLRLQVVNENSSSGVVLYRDETLAAIAPGDAVGILGAAPSVGAPVLVAANPDAKIPAAPVKFETGGSNLSVPKADRTYELLASLAAQGLIQSQPAIVFQDDGARRHRTAEDIIFSRAQVAGFIREAISNSEGGKKSRAALGILTKDFRADLIQAGETATTLSPFSEGGVAVGVSGFSRYSLTVGNTDISSRDPFSESFGARRSRSGSDSRTNVFGQLSSRLNFYGSVDYGSDIRRGNTNYFDVAAGLPTDRDLISNLQVRKAYVSYDAGNLLRGLTLDIGRKEFWWGTGHFGTSTLGDSSGGLNSFSTRFERASYRFEGMYAYLGRGPAGGARSIYGQNLSVKLGQQARVGVTTTILSPKDRFDPKLFLGALTPISLYVLDRQGDLEDRTNAIAGGYVEASIARGARVYGEILLDDLSVSGNNRIEERQGSVVGAQFFNPKDPAKAGFTVEYARFNSLSYLAFIGANRDADYYYQNRNAPLGYPISPTAPTNFGGSNSLRFEGYYTPIKKLRLHAGLEFSDINSEDQNPARAGFDTRGFSRQRVVRLAASYQLSKAFTLTARAQRTQTDQPTFVHLQSGQSDRFASLEISRSF